MALTNRQRRILMAAAHAQAAATIVPTNFQLVSTFTGVSNMAATTVGSFTRNMGRLGHFTGNANIRRLKLVDAGWSITPGSGLEANQPSNAQTFTRALERTGGGRSRFLYDGVENFKIAASGETIFSEDLGDLITIPANTQFWTRLERINLLSTDKLNGIDRVGLDDDGCRTNGASQLMASGVINTAGTSGGPVYWPTMLLGIPDRPLAAVGWRTDSIGNGQGDSNSSGSAGLLHRAFNNVNGYKVPWHRQTVGGATMVNCQVAVSPKTTALWQYLTDIFFHLGTNDIVFTTDLEVLKARFVNMASFAHSVVGPYGYRLRVHASSIIPRGGFSAAQNTLRTGYNNWLASGANGYCDKYYDINAAAGDFTTYPADQVHPGPTDHANMAAVIASEFVPYLDPLFEARLAA
ncbi:SGNH/GDSL hydrolase family protein [Rhizobium sp. SU303]|uniref:SGNH/GDSL hydrolase family protein n=1 Tax=Rhizobium sp. SU303 TaxID=3138065 RepID=UPI001E391CD7|nr:SGNH/GDSL hydrolase family protein [Rhizobium leguminosarum]UFW80037.1 SGNH/GDSL hydrolase family protein [Rhizobium leguminosarum bv. viciae]